jgi:3-hydroxy-9,10-secoandrosta-1,3,5(10)-triene-9,17-dione monooxygenase
MEEPEFQRLYGEALCRADAAEALALAATRLYFDQCQRWAQEALPVRAEDSLQVWGISREGCRAACEAVEMLFHSIGASVVRRGERLQRYFRDVQMYRVHFQSQAFSPVLRSRVQLGLPIPPPFHR